MGGVIYPRSRAASNEDVRRRWRRARCGGEPRGAQHELAPALRELVGPLSSFFEPVDEVADVES
jgi:hypothetical protein